MKVLKRTTEELFVRQEKFKCSEPVQLTFTVSCFLSFLDFFLPFTGGVIVLLFLPTIFFFLCDFHFPGITLTLNKEKNVVVIRYRISILYVWFKFPLDELGSVYSGQESQYFYAGYLGTTIVEMLYVTRCRRNGKERVRKISLSSRKDATTLSSLIHNFRFSQGV
jgi:hypothetical protein